jgi:hypothetical protein
MKIKEIFGTKGQEVAGDWRKLFNEGRYVVH